MELCPCTGSARRRISFARSKREGLLDRQIESLPRDAELTERKARASGPDASRSCRSCFRTRRSSSTSSCSTRTCRRIRIFRRSCARYFPVPLQEKYAAHMQRHRLKREIIATAVTNSMVNRMGATFTLRMRRTPASGRPRSQGVFGIVREISTRARSGPTSRRSTARSPTRCRSMRCSRSGSRARPDALAAQSSRRRRSTSPSIVARYAPAMRELRAALPRVLSRAGRAITTSTSRSG